MVLHNWEANELTISYQLIGLLSINDKQQKIIFENLEKIMPINYSLYI